MIYRISIYSLILVFCMACSTDKAEQNTRAEVVTTDEKSHIPDMDQPVIVIEDTLEAEAATRPTIDPNATIKGIENSKNFTRKGVKIAGEKVNSAGTSAYASLANKSFKAMGNEPFWNIEIKGEELMFHQMGFKKEYYELRPIQIKIDRLVYDVIDKSGKHDIKLELMKAKCEDDMSGQPFAFSVLLTKDETQFRGCAKEIFE